MLFGAGLRHLSINSSKAVDVYLSQSVPDSIILHRTLIWIIDEKKLYGDAIYNINQKGYVSWLT